MLSKLIESEPLKPTIAERRPCWNERTLEFLFARPRPVAVALHGVDLAVVGEVAERLRQAPFRPGVGGEALVEHGQRGGEARVVEVGVEHRQIFRHHQALVGITRPDRVRI